MADFTPTAASVQVPSGASVVNGTSGEAINAGQLIYKDLADSKKLKKARANAIATAKVEGIAVGEAAGADQILPYVRLDSGVIITVGTGVTVGKIYVLSAATAGSMADDGDLTTGQFVSIVGIGITSTTIMLVGKVSDTAKP